MTTLFVVHWIHLVAAATWTGGLIVLAALIVALRRAGAERELLRAAARQFGRVGWVAMGVAVATGLWQVALEHLPWSYGRLHLKLTLVAAAIALSLFHQLTAKRTSPAARGVIQLVLLLVSLGIFGAAAAL